ncbi:MAG: proton-conducting membrane transporter [Clostridia bacterium]|nr:proton-conducting membrane transporter [Clostridia bacterium]
MILLLTILLPLVGGFALHLIRPSSQKVRLWYVEGVVLCTSMLCLYCLLNPSTEPLVLYSIMDHLPIALRVDGCGSVFAGLVAILWPLATFYGMEYMMHEERPNTFFVFYTMTYGVTMGICFSANLFTLYMFYECLTMITLPLVAHKRDPESQLAARNYVIFSVTGAAMAFVGMIFMVHYGLSVDFVLGGNLDPTKIAGREDALRWIFLLSLVGFGTKAAIFPMHAWLPMVSVAPTPVTALLHAVAVVNAGAFAVIRLIYYSFGPDLLYGSFAQTIALCLTSFTIVYSSVMAVKEQHLKRRLAYSTSANLAYMLMGACLCTPAGLVGSLMHMVCHGFMKITLFWCVGAVMIYTGKTRVQEVRGLNRIMPKTCLCYTVAAIALTGTPPLCGFVSKWQLLTAANAISGWGGIVATVALIVSAVLSAVYALSISFEMYFRPLPEGSGTASRDPGLLILLPLLFCLVVIVLLGVYSSPLLHFLQGIAGVI